MKPFFAWKPLAPPQETAMPEWIQRAALVGVILALSGGLIQSGLGLDQGGALIFPLAVSALLFGLPHGAIDHLVALGLAGRTLQPGNVLLVAGIYLLLALLYGGLWLIAPGLALLGFLAMTFYHWGKADTVFELLRCPGGALAKDRRLRWIHTAVRGGIPMGMPLLAFPEASAAFLQSCLALFIQNPASPELWRPWIAGALFSLITLECLLLFRAKKDSGCWHIIIETLLLLALFTWVPPLAAIGWYFCLWHGLRHVLRLARYRSGPGNGLTKLRALRLFFYRAIPFTLLSLLFLALAGLALPVAGEPTRWIALYLVLISALTFPHIILVEWMDREEKL